MYKFDISIEQNGIEYRNGQWVYNLVSNIIELSKLTEKELDAYALGIKAHIERNMFSSLDFRGNKLQPHSFWWGLKKGHHKNLFWEGVLYRSIATRKIPEGREVFVLPNIGVLSKTPRDIVAARLQKDWPFWGIIPERADSILQSILLHSSRFRQAA